MTTIDELQRTVEQDEDGASTRLKQLEAAVSELRRIDRTSIAHPLYGIYWMPFIDFTRGVS